MDQEAERKWTAEDVSKSISTTSKPGRVVAPGGAQAGPADDLGGVRHEGGGSL